MSVKTDIVEQLESALNEGRSALKKAYENRASYAEFESVRLRVVSLEDAYWAGVAAALEDNNEVVKGVRKDLDDEIIKLKAQLVKMQDIAEVINILGEMAKLAGAIVTLAKV